MNDTLGHQAGDMALTRVGNVIKEVIRASDIGCRWGGEEFCLALPGSDLAHAKDITLRLRDRLAVVNAETADHVTFTFSAGIAQWKPGEDLRAIMHRADERFPSEEPRPRSD